MAGSMVATISSELKLPFDDNILPLVASHVRELARHAKLPQEKIEALERSVLEASANIIKYAYEPGEAVAFGLKTEVMP